MSTFKANAFLLKNLLDSIEIGDIQLPDFQRGWVWDDARIKDLLVSISRGFPIGAVMTLDASGDVQFVSKLIEGVEEDGKGSPEQYLLDGQQRLTSLYQSLRHKRAVATRNRPGSQRTIERWYYVDMRKALDQLADRDDAIFSVPEDKVVRSNFGRDVVLDLSSPESEFRYHMMPTEEVMDGMGWGFAYAQYWQGRGGHPHGDSFSFFTAFKNAVLDNFSEYQVPVINLGRDTRKEAVCTVFEKVNTGGVTLSVFELVTASFAGGDFRLRDDWVKRSGRMHSAFGVLQGIRGDQFLQAVTLLATQARRRRAESDGKPLNLLPGIDCRRESILDLKLSEYREWADLVEKGFMEAARFLNRQFIFTNSNVPYNTQLAPLATLYAELGKELEPANAQDKLERWFWSGVMGEMYGSAVETRFANDLAQVASYVRGGAEPELLTQANFVPERLLSLRTRNSAAYKGLYALQMKNGAADWRSGEALSFADIHTKSIDIHHIFPRHWCENVARPAIPRRLFDSIINKTPVDSYTNRMIGGRAPSRYLPILWKYMPESRPKERLDGILRAHWIVPHRLEKDDFGHCFVERGQAMLDLITRTMGKLSVDGRQVFRDELKAVSLGLGQVDDEEVEHDPVGESAYSDTEAPSAAMDIERRFHEEMLGIYREATGIGYYPSYFLQMVAEQGGLSAAKRLLGSNTPSSGFVRLWEEQRLDLSVEALALQEPWNSLFTDVELTEARRRLEDLEYDPGRSA